MPKKSFVDGKKQELEAILMYYYCCEWNQLEQYFHINHRGQENKKDQARECICNRGGNETGMTGDLSARDSGRDRHISSGKIVPSAFLCYHIWKDNATDIHAVIR